MVQPQLLCLPTPGFRVLELKGKMKLVELLLLTTDYAD